MDPVRGVGADDTRGAAAGEGEDREDGCSEDSQVHISDNSGTSRVALAEYVILSERHRREDLP
jgi:hypothetical protein